MRIKSEEWGNESFCQVENGQAAVFEMCRELVAQQMIGSQYFCPLVLLGNVLCIFFVAKHIFALVEFWTVQCSCIVQQFVVLVQSSREAISPSGPSVGGLNRPQEGVPRLDNSLSSF